MGPETNNYLQALNTFLQIKGEQRDLAMQEILIEIGLEDDYYLPNFIHLADEEPLDRISLGLLSELLEVSPRHLRRLVLHQFKRKRIKRNGSVEYSAKDAIHRLNQFKDKLLLMGWLQELEVPEVYLRTSILTVRLKSEYGASSTNATAQVNSLISQGCFVESNIEKAGHKEKLFELTDRGKELSMSLAKAA